MLCLVEKNVFLSENLPCIKNTQTLFLYRALPGVPWDDYCFERFNVFFDLLPEKDIPPETEH